MQRLITFGQFNVSPREFFFASKLSMALVNFKPLVPGHVLVISKRRASKFADLSVDEVADLWTSVQRVSSVVQRHVGAPSCTLAIQDGKEAGQTVDHVHVHVIPRRSGDFGRNDEVYERLDADGVARPPPPMIVDDDKRVARTLDVMAAEADALRALFDEHERFQPDLEASEQKA